MRELTTVGIDLAKNVFAVHAVDRDGRVVLRRLVGRGKLAELIAQLPPSLIGMESCTGAHEWAQRFQAGAGSFCASDGTDVCGTVSQERQERRQRAEAICEAVSRPNMRFVPIKALDQQALLTLHRVRQGFVVERTAVVNRIRGLLAEFGVVIPQRVQSLRRELPAQCETLPSLAVRAIRSWLNRASNFRCSTSLILRMPLRLAGIGLSPRTKSGSLASGQGSSADSAGSFRANVTEDSGIVTGDSGRKPKIGHLPAESVVTFVRNGRSRSSAISGHDGPEYARFVGRAK